MTAVAGQSEEAAPASDVTTDAPADVPTEAQADVPTEAQTDAPADVEPGLSTEVPTATPTATPTVVPTATPTAIPTATPIPLPTVLQQVVQRSNDQQVQAIATRNLSLVADTVTDDHFRDLANTLQDLLNHKVTGIALLKLDWGPIVVAADGSSAVVTTFETWRVVSQEGSVDDAPHRNDYTLVRDNATATWRIKSTVQVPLPPQPGAVVAPQ
jgi:hypothetical protein